MSHEPHRSHSSQVDVGRLLATLKSQAVVLNRAQSCLKKCILTAPHWSLHSIPGYSTLFKGGIPTSDFGLGTSNTPDIRFALSFKS